jgi:hypothetical protein
MAAKQGLDMNHKVKLAGKMKDVRNAIEEGINTQRDVSHLEEIFARIEQEFWDEYPESPTGTQIKSEMQ